ncbi:hypothetical protein O181_056655 [Austropuccinia psidii MF-1]|uniref:Uncharacterized protein n=1 Tax=Austropuccinia psidii MF-1 TaxID=1389203 RepID=A0A9Q3HWA6_9BASI|nr:hypothetical protein [Austropuccinia psidii MF-1]
MMNKPNPIASKNTEMDLLLKADIKDEISHQFSQFPESICPQLIHDNVNFTSWQKILLNSWRMYYNGKIEYFEEDANHENPLQNLVAILFIKNIVLTTMSLAKSLHL